MRQFVEEFSYESVSALEPRKLQKVRDSGESVERHPERAGAPAGGGGAAERGGRRWGLTGGTGRRIAWPVPGFCDCFFPKRG